LGVKQRSARVARVDRGVGLDTVGVLQERSGRVLVAVNTRDDPVGDGRLEVGSQQERVTHCEAPIAGLNLVAVGHLGVREVVASEEFDQRHVAHRIDAHDNGVVELAVGHTALHGVAARSNDVEVGQRVSIGRNNDSRPAAPAAGGEDGQHRHIGLGHGGDPLILGL